MLKICSLILALLILSFCNKKNTNNLKYKYSTDTLKMCNLNQFEFLHFDSKNDKIFFIMKQFNNDTLFIKQLDTDTDSLLSYRYSIFKDIYPSNQNKGIIEKIIFEGKDSLIFFEYLGTNDKGTSSRIFIFDLNKSEVVFNKNFDVDYNNKPTYTIDKEFVYCNTSQSIVYVIWPYVEINQFISLYDIKANKNKLLEVSKPEEYNIKENEINPFSTIVYLTLISENKLIIAFGISSDIIEYDLASKNFKTHKVENTYNKKSKFLIKEGKPLNYHEVLRVLELSYLNTDFEYDPNKNLYYRFFSKEMPDKDKDGYYTDIFKHKENGISVIDSNFKFIGDVTLPPDFRKFLKRPRTITSKGIWHYEKNENEIIIHKINIIKP